MNQLIKPLLNNPITFISSTNYGDHYKFGVKIFRKQVFWRWFENYRVELEINYVNSSIHPQTHIEFFLNWGLWVISHLLFFSFFKLY